MESATEHVDLSADLLATGDAERMLDWCVPSDIQVITVFACGINVDKVCISRARIVDGRLDVEPTVKKACEGMNAYKYVTTGILALEGTPSSSAKVQPVNIASKPKWPKTLRAISALDALVIVARRQPRICLTRRNLVAGARRRRTRRRNGSSKIETA